MIFSINTTSLVKSNALPASFSSCVTKVTCHTCPFLPIPLPGQLSTSPEAGLDNEPPKPTKWWRSDPATGWAHRTEDAQNMGEKEIQHSSQHYIYTLYIEYCELINDNSMCLIAFPLQLGQEWLEHHHTLFHIGKPNAFQSSASPEKHLAQLLCGRGTSPADGGWPYRLLAYELNQYKSYQGSSKSTWSPNISNKNAPSQWTMTDFASILAS